MTFQLSDYYLSFNIDELFTSNGYTPPTGNDRDAAVKMIESFIFDSISSEIDALMEYASVSLEKIDSDRTKS